MSNEESWKCDKCGELKVIGSVAELEELSGQKITDLHKDKMDKIKLKCAKCGKEIKTSYAPDRPETVYCKQCYNNEVA